MFTRDTDDREYVTLTEEARKNNTRGGKMDESMADKLMYATGETNCPVEMLRLLIKKLFLQQRGYSTRLTLIVLNIQMHTTSGMMTSP